MSPPKRAHRLTLMATTDSYDEIPYQSTPFRETHPGFLAPLVRLFGLEAAAPERCRVLELGCASGGNLIPMAFHLPESRFLGLELSASQARAGAESLESLGLQNIEIRQGDILAFDPEAGRFDYIIAHGVYSWAPPAVREKILSICRDHLSENGVAYVSYNTLPGWRMRGVLRDMLLFHTRALEVPAERLAAAQAYLVRLAPVLKAQDTLSARYLGYEIDRIRANHPSYLFHEYLETHNQPFLFSEFVADAAAHGLRYLCDTELHTLFPSTLGDEAAEFLSEIPDDIGLWQHMDFLMNRNFRQSLLCRQERFPLEAPDMDTFTAYAFYADLRPPKKLDLRRVKAAPFVAADGSERRASHPLTKAALVQLHAAYPASIAFAELAQRARDAVRSAANAAAAEEVDHLASELFGFYAHQAIGATLTPESSPPAPSESPRASPLALTQAFAGGQVPTARHFTLDLDPFGARLLAMLDGTRTLAALKEELVAEGPALFGRSLQPGPRGEELIRTNVDRLIALFAQHGIVA